METDPTYVHAGLVAELARTDGSLWRRLIGCRVLHHQFGPGILVGAQNGQKFIHFKFDADQKQCKFNVSSLANGNTAFDLPIDVFKELAPLLENPSALMKRAEKASRRLERRARRERVRAEAKKTPKTSTSKKGSTSSDIMDRARRLPGSFENGKQK